MVSETMSEPDPSFQRFRLLVAYDGRPYCGWQSQATGDTIQDRLLEALRSLCPDAKGLVGSGRTDAGVSAEGSGRSLRRSLFLENERRELA
jgi:tRNA pseudouridine(38-40) synthase